MSERNRKTLKLNNAIAEKAAEELVDILYCKQINLRLYFKKLDCSGVFEYPNGNKRKATTSEIIGFFTLYNQQ